MGFSSIADKAEVFESVSTEKDFDGILLMIGFGWDSTYYRRQDSRIWIILYILMQPRQ